MNESTHQANFAGNSEVLGLHWWRLVMGLLLTILIHIIKFDRWNQNEWLLKSTNLILWQRSDQLIQLAFLPSDELFVMANIELVFDALLILDGLWEAGRSNDLLLLIHFYVYHF